MKIRSTTVVAVKRNGRVAMAGDGQVTAGNTIAKGNARKVRKIYDGKVLTGFAGSVADAFTLLDKFEGKLKECNGDILRASVELAKILLISGDGNVIEPESDVMAIGSGGNYAFAAALAFMESSQLSAKEIALKSMDIASKICIYTNANFVLEEI